ncbi:Phage-related baseplate assembly protein [Photorhabdus australis subsp. thailandensis]|uniref:Phage-related baseplate assembly protein n=1 Tax=Photorhabdus australis subsp. thailandensis TaxID=2805096 RepID=A0A1C0U3N5_9GAMM|nr:phage baseplate assembly protein V [Photorhabdus australis]OCQ52495.1 Phage-related baseplate assembly protein [Photorhabdus australis subsp. thailandensis]
MSHQLKIIADGKALSLLAAVDVDTCYRVNSIPSATLKLSVPDRPLSSFNQTDVQTELAHCQVGKTLRLELIDGSKKWVLFNGLITRKALRIKNKQLLLTLVVKHRLQLMVDTQHSQLFKDKSEKAILSTLLNQAGINARFGKIAALDQKHEQMVQFRCSDWHFLLCRLSATGAWLLPAIEDVQFVQPDALKSNSVYTLKSRGDENKDIVVKDAYWQFDNQINPALLEVSGWDISKQQVQSGGRYGKVAVGKAALSPDGLASLNKAGWDICYSSPLTTQESGYLAQGLLLNQRISGVTGEFLLKGDGRYQLGDNIQLTGFGSQLDGTASITEVRHRLNRRIDWETTVSIGLQHEYLPILPDAPELHIATVAKYQQDSAVLNRIPIILPVLNRPNEFLWARLGKPYASHESGFCFYPEPGDEVIVGFFENDPRYPVILGAMHNPKNKAPFEPTQDNREKVLVVKKGETQQQLVIDGKEKIIRINAGENQITLQQDKDISLSTKKELTLKAQTMNATMDKSLAMSGKNSVEIKGAKINLTQ